MADQHPPEPGATSVRPVAGERATEGKDVPEAQSADAAATIAELRARVAELEDRWRRAAADLENMRKRAAQEMARQQAQERARVAAEWLPILDNLDLALAHAESDPAAIIEGVRAVRDQAVALLARLGFARHDDVGTTFDPARHEAVNVVTDPQVPPGTIVRVLRPGYGDGERQLRPAAVVVAAPAARSDDGG
jgi:molecular chaperone GrpE